MTDSGLEIIGFRYPESGYLPYRGGLVVIYGQNGAGKSLLLESLESSLVGRMIGRTPVNRLGKDLVQSAVIARTCFTDLGVDYLDPSTLNGRDLLRSALDEAMSATQSADWDVLRPAWSRLLEELGNDDVAILAPTGRTESQWTAYAALDPDSPAHGAWAAAVDADFVATSNGYAHDDREAAFREWCCSNDTVDGYRELEDHISGLNGFLAGEGPPFRFNGYVRSIRQSPFGSVITEATIELERSVLDWVRAALTMPGEYQPDGSYLGPSCPVDEIGPRLLPTADGWALRANQLLQRFLLDAPELRLVIGEPAAWVAGAQPRWETVAGVPIARLSDAEVRWSKIAIALAAPDRYSVQAGDPEFSIDGGSALAPPYILLDEPERGLHRAAEAYLAEGLLALAATARVRPILATHSPSLLDAGEGQIFHITKTGQRGIGQIDELLPSEVDELKDFGLQPSSLLNRDRGYLLVEGVQDKAILEGWFADELKSMRVAVLAMHGTANLLNVFDSEFLIHRTDALLMPLLDDVAVDPLLDLWAETEAKVEDGRRSDAFGLIMRGMGGIRGGARDYGPLLAGTITRGVSQRFFPLGMSKKDVLEYLPVESLVEGASSWTDLWKEWKRSPAAIANRPGGGGGATAGAGKSYKDWLRRRGADLSPENLRLIAETTNPHPELKAVVARVASRLG